MLQMRSITSMTASIDFKFIFNTFKFWPMFIIVYEVQAINSYMSLGFSWKSKTANEWGSTGAR